MKYRRFESTELTTSELGLGCARIRSVFQTHGKAESIRMIERAFDAGITFFDTFYEYGQGYHAVSCDVVDDHLLRLRSRDVPQIDRGVAPMIPEARGAVGAEARRPRTGTISRRRLVFFFFQAEDGIRDVAVTGVQTCALPIFGRRHGLDDLVAFDHDGGVMDGRRFVSVEQHAADERQASWSLRPRR